ncbi:MAG: dephospho-CoA kinase [Clostridia bacterium]|nr:dephospho-CoA kinase [Clostridia bacterium]
MKVIGLCGGSGSGKGTVARLLMKYGIFTVDTDAVYHNITSHKSECLDALVAAFGEQILSKSGGLDRKRLSEIVFSGDNAAMRRAELNKIAHKYVLKATREKIAAFEASGAAAVTVDAPLLFESGFDSECDAVLAVLADENSRIARIMRRDGVTERDAVLRIRSQLPDEYLREKADYVIENNGTPCDLLSGVEEVAAKILND